MELKQIHTLTEMDACTCTVPLYMYDVHVHVYQNNVDIMRSKREREGGIPVFIPCAPPISYSSWTVLPQFFFILYSVVH